MKKALFLDRDGVINIDHGYVHKIKDFDFVEGIFELCQKALEKGYLIFVITNQAGIARGLYSVDDFKVLTDWMINQFRQNSIDIKDVFYCPHHYEKGINEYKKKCNCRKPEPGMLLEAKNKYQLDLASSVFIGDKITDMQAAEAAGIENRILIQGNYIDEQSVRASRVSQLSLATRLIK